ncbi:hypothetical protein [Botrimarina mediterranea]|uniref:Uncharacterized protein n=1 Tax=Botrimarina mediterranea TaxID=2528022 RepID=A0A518K9T4_9BACT|nr:hypothetical protein [Botrimarina mediterranea]QDV74540.1 hypothetical protein Spa11_27440 [Botrimarina mediterranea]QDV79180.1 hypothetical protein K2D_27910 [Planctomycetes bacterium K2D]
MDPQKCWEEICSAVNEQRSEDLQASVDAMLEWLDKGGDPPLVSLHSGQVTCVSNKEVLAMFVRSLCRKYLKIAKEWPMSV